MTCAARCGNRAIRAIGPSCTPGAAAARGLRGWRYDPAAERGDSSATWWPTDVDRPPAATTTYSTYWRTGPRGTGPGVCSPDTRHRRPNHSRWAGDRLTGQPDYVMPVLPSNSEAAPRCSHGSWLCVPILDFPGVEWSTMQSLGEEILAERLTPWRERYRKVRVRTIVVCDRPAHQPVEQSKSAQLVVIGSHGRVGFRNASWFGQRRGDQLRTYTVIVA